MTKGKSAPGAKGKGHRRNSQCKRNAVNPEIQRIKLRRHSALKRLITYRRFKPISPNDREYHYTLKRTRLLDEVHSIRSIHIHMITRLTENGNSTFKRLLFYVPPALTFRNSVFCPHNEFMCFAWISEQTAIISQCSINLSVFITASESVYCAVRTETSNQIDTFRP
jgi:hypothetical protein